MPALTAAVNHSIVQVEPLVAKATDGVKSSTAQFYKSTTALITQITPLLALSPSSIMSIVVISKDEWKALLDRNVIPAAKAPARETVLNPFIVSATPQTSAILNNLVEFNKATTDFIDTIDWEMVKREAIPLAAGGVAFIVTTNLLIPSGAVFALKLIGFGALGPIHGMFSLFWFI